MNLLEYIADCSKRLKDEMSEYGVNEYTALSIGNELRDIAFASQHVVQMRKCTYDTDVCPCVSLFSGKQKCWICKNGIEELENGRFDCPKECPLAVISRNGWLILQPLFFKYGNMLTYGVSNGGTSCAPKWIVEEVCKFLDGVVDAMGRKGCTKDCQPTTDENKGDNCPFYRWCWNSQGRCELSLDRGGEALVGERPFHCAFGAGGLGTFEQK